MKLSRRRRWLALLGAAVGAAALILLRRRGAAGAGVQHVGARHASPLQTNATDLPYRASANAVSGRDGSRTAPTTQPRPCGRMLQWLALGCMTAAALIFQGGGALLGMDQETIIFAGLLLIAAGMVVMASAPPLISPPTHASPPAAAPLHPVLFAGMRPLPLLLGIGALAWLTVVNVGALPPLHMHAQFALLAGGAALTTWGLAGKIGGWQIERREGWALAAILLLALVVRAWNLNDAVRWYVDEFLFADTYTMLRDQPTQPLLAPQVGLSSIVWVYPYMQWWTVSAFGADFAGLRAISVVIGVATVAATYGLARALFVSDDKNSRTVQASSLRAEDKMRTAQASSLQAGRLIPVLAALLLAVFPPHVHFSRLGLYNIADPLFGVLALACMARALRRGGRGSYALAGTLLALTGYFYEGGRVFYPALLAAWLLALAARAWWTRRGGSPTARTDWRIDGRGLVVLALAAFITAAPLYITIRSMSGFASRVEQIGGLQTGALAQPGQFWLDRLRPALLHLLYFPDESGWHYGGSTPLLLLYSAPFALFGLARLWFGRGAGGGQNVNDADGRGIPQGGFAHPRPYEDALRGVSLLTLWVALTGVGNSLLDFTGFTARFVVVFPALAILAAAGLAGVWDMVRGDWNKDAPVGAQHPVPLRGDADSVAGVWRAKSLRIFAFATLVCVVILGQIVYYFGTHIPFYNQQLRPYRDYIDVMYRSLDFPPDTGVYVIVRDTADVFLPHYEVLRKFLGVDAQVNVVAAEAVTLPWLAQRYVEHRPYAFFVEPDDPVILDLINRWFAPLPPQFSPYNVPLDRQYLLLLALPGAPES